MGNQFSNLRNLNSVDEEQAISTFAYRTDGDAKMQKSIRDGQYTGAREVLDFALAQDQILGVVDDPPGVQVMTVHKSKGKQFDGVIVVRESRHDGQQMVSSFVWWGDVPPYHRSRKILRVAITRAKTHTLMLAPIWSQYVRFRLRFRRFGGRQ
jgi:superfamily I DNA/RNA helicase